MIKEILIKDTHELIHLLNDYPNNFVFRGHANSDWSLESTLERMLGSKWISEGAKFEDHYLKLFQSKYDIYKENELAPGSKLAWLSVMQHYGVPTRLIDFTESPYVALYFAMEAYLPQDKSSLSMYALDYTAIMQASLNYVAKKDTTFNKTRNDLAGNQDQIFVDFVDRFSYDVVWVTEPHKLNKRMDRQAGTFLIAGDRSQKIESLLAGDIYSGCEVNKLVIPYELYEPIYALLRKMNINAKSIYGDLAGLAKTIKMEMQVYSRP